MPLFDQSTYTFASDDQKAEIEALANQCRDDLAAATNESALYSAAMTYVPQAFTALGSSVEATQALYYTGSGLFTPSDLSSYNTNDGGNNITDAVKQRYRQLDGGRPWHELHDRAQPGPHGAGHGG